MNFWEKRRTQILVVLLLLLAASLYYTHMQSQPQLLVSPSTKTHSPRGVEPTDEKLLLGLLSRKPPRFGGIVRNVFEFREGGEETETAAMTGVPGQPGSQTTPAVAAAPPAPEVRYMGYYKEREGSGVKLAAIINGGQVFVGAPGDVLADKYQIVEINEEYLVVKLIHEDRTIRLPLGKP